MLTKMALNKTLLLAMISTILSLVVTVHATGPSTPSIRVVPMPAPQSTLIYYKTQDSASRSNWTNAIDKFLEPYHNHKQVSNRVVCTYTHGLSDPGENQVCDMPVEDFGPCAEKQQYGYHRGTPCVFLKLDNILNWEPKLYNSSKNLPDNMPEDLKRHINLTSGPEANTVWVSCEGESPADKEFIGPVQYFPRRGFPAYYYPFTNKEGYLSPLVAVHFERPLTGMVISISCRAWAKNIADVEGHGAAHFELMID